MDHGSKRCDGDDEAVAPRERVRLVYRPRHQPDEVELPLRLLMLGDYAQRPDPRPVGEREPIEIDKDSFEAVMRAQRLTITFAVEDTRAGQEGRRRDVTLRFRHLRDMEPEAIARQVPQLAALEELRRGLTSIKGPLGGHKPFRNIIQRYVDDPSARRRLREEIGLPLEEEPASAPQAPRAEALVQYDAENGPWQGARRERAARAANPDTPPDVLFELSREFPGEVARNPVLPLVTIEIADWLSRLSPQCVKEVLRQGLVAPPEVLIAQICGASEASLREIAAGDPRTAPAALSALASDRSWSMSTALLQNPSLPLETWRRLVSDDELTAWAARWPGAPADWLRDVSTHRNLGVREAIAAHPGLPADALGPLARDADASVRREIARRRDLPPDLLRALASDADASVRGQVAANPLTPPDLLPVFADDCPTARNGLLGNRTTPPLLRERVCAQNRADWAATMALIRPSPPRGHPEP